MRNASRWAVVVLTAATLGVWAIPSRGEEPATQPSADTQGATGTVTGTVMLDGKPLANARVGLIDMAQAKEMRNRAAAQGSETGATTQPSGKEKHQRPTPAATAMTDSDGKFTLSDVKAGQYVVLAQAKGEGRGACASSSTPARRPPLTSPSNQKASTPVPACIPVAPAKQARRPDVPLATALVPPYWTAMTLGLAASPPRAHFVAHPSVSRIESAKIAEPRPIYRATVELTRPVLRGLVTNALPAGSHDA